MSNRIYSSSEIMKKEAKKELRDFYFVVGSCALAGALLYTFMKYDSNKQEQKDYFNKTNTVERLVR